jgi:hypothetical protein
MPVANNTFHAFLVHLASNAEKMHLVVSPSIATDKTLDAWPCRPSATELDLGPTSLLLLGNFAKKGNSKTENLRM